MKLIAIITIILINSVCFGQPVILTPQTLTDDELSEIIKRTEEKATLSIPSIAFIDDQIPTTYQFDIEELFKAKEICFSYQGNNVQCFNAKALATYFYMSMEGKK